jgi:hypothetical protein
MWMWMMRMGSSGRCPCHAVAPRVPAPSTLLPLVLVLVQALHAGSSHAVEPTSAATSVASARPLRLAVWPLEANGFEPWVMRLLDESLLAELRKRQRVSVVGMDEIRQVLDFEAQK